MQEGVAGAGDFNAYTGKARTIDSLQVKDKPASSSGPVAKFEPSPYAANDPKRYQDTLLRSADIPRLLAASFARKGVSSKLVACPYFMQAFKVLGVTLPHPDTIDTMQNMEAKQALEENRRWFDHTEFGTLCGDGRVMNTGPPQFRSFCTHMCLLWHNTMK